jgi:uncharacterized protein YaaR (DUF327 family)
METHAGEQQQKLKEIVEEIYAKGNEENAVSLHTFIGEIRMLLVDLLK